MVPEMQAMIDDTFHEEFYEDLVEECKASLKKLIEQK